MYAIKLKSIKFPAALLITLQLLACSEKPGVVIADIKFSNPELPPSVIEVSGLSVVESWGRWSDANAAPTVKIRFKQSLPRQFTLTLTGQALPNNETAIVKIGAFQEQFFLRKLSDIAIIDIKLDQPEDTIEIIPHDPASPKSLGLNDDTRKLGVGLATMLIEK